MLSVPRHGILKAFAELQNSCWKVQQLLPCLVCVLDSTSELLWTHGNESMSVTLTRFDIIHKTSDIWEWLIVPVGSVKFITTDTCCKTNNMIMLTFSHLHGFTPLPWYIPYMYHYLVGDICMWDIPEPTALWHIIFWKVTGKSVARSSCIPNYQAIRMVSETMILL